MTSKKRVRLATADGQLDADDSQALHDQISPSSSTHSQPHPVSSFRNVSACNRCRVRKNRCDQNLPACSACEKAGVKCVGFDPLTKREIPRTYVYYLESRINYLETLLSDHGIDFAPPEDFDLGSKTSVGEPENAGVKKETTTAQSASQAEQEKSSQHRIRRQNEQESLDKLVSNIGMVSVQGASDPRYLGSTSGISFARVVFQAVKSSAPNSTAEIQDGQNGKSMANFAAPSMRDSFFGLQSKPAVKPAPLPDQRTGIRLANLYFEYANPQIPTLHRGEFFSMLLDVYADEDKPKTSKELYMLNIVFAIGAGIILEDTSSNESPSSFQECSTRIQNKSPTRKKRKLSDVSKQPEEYHAAAMLHLEPFLGSMPSAEHREGSVNGLDQLQAVLLLASFALLRPVAPGLWYIVGVAVRLAVDLGLHHEDPAEVDHALQRSGQFDNEDEAQTHSTTLLAGRCEWIRDLRRRLWWCAYSFDRLVSTCVGRPFGITDQAITAEFPSVLDDDCISQRDGLKFPGGTEYTGPSYKRVSHHYFRLRLLQSEMLQVLQYRQAQKAHRRKKDGANKYMHTTLSSSFLQPFTSFHAWRRDIDRRLWEWKQDAPSQKDTNVEFCIEFLELNYWQAVIMLYRQTLSTPEGLAGEKSPTEDVASPFSSTMDDVEEEDEIYLKVAEAGQRVLKLYRQLHRVHLVNYTYLATVHLFMAGIAFLYAIWHSPTVRSRLTLDDVDFTVLAATSVLKDLVDKCPPAEACRGAFDRMSKATIKMCLSTTGFGPEVVRHVVNSDQKYGFDTSLTETTNAYSQARSIPDNTRPAPRFDMNLRALFTEDTLDETSAQSTTNQWSPPIPSTVSSLHHQTSQVPNVSPNYPAMPEPQQPASTWNPVPAVDVQGSAPSHGLHGYPAATDLLMSDDGSGGVFLDFDNDMSLDSNLDGAWTQGPQLEFFDNFFFGGSTAAPI